MNNFKTLEGAMEMFKNNNCLGTENCIFATFKDTNADGMKAGAAGAIGGAVGGAIAAFASGMASTLQDGSLQNLNGFEGMLINQTENGLGLIPLNVKGVQLMLNIDKMEADPSKFVFVSNDNIEEITVKKFNIFNKKVQRVKIVIKGGTTLRLLAHVSEKNISYQESNFAKFMNKYSK